MGFYLRNTEHNSEEYLDQISHNISGKDTVWKQLDIKVDDTDIKRK